MKAILKTLHVNSFKAMSILALLLAVMNTNRVCFACFHQPTPPSALNKYRKH